MSISENEILADLSVEEVAGFWRLAVSSSTRDEGPLCFVSFNPLPQPGGYGLLVEKCELPALEGATGWRLAPGGFEVYSRDGTPSMRFRRVGVDAFLTLDASYRLERTPVS